LVEQSAAPLSLQTPRGSGVAAGRGEQRPIADGSEQLEHAPPHGPSQHTPSTQKLLPHSDAAAQLWPSALSPQLPWTHACPDWQSSSTVHDVAHAPFEQLKGQQFCTPGARHAPLPSQVPAVLSRPPAQVGGAQTVSAG
jgi:hypothetical protein